MKNNPFGWRSFLRRLEIGSDLDEDVKTAYIQASEFGVPITRPQLMQPLARRMGPLPAEEYIPHSFSVIGNWKTDKLWY